MDKAKLIAHLTDSSSLYNTSYEELKSLAIQYPYNTNFKYLLLSKSRLENHTEVDRNLQVASTYSIDRSFLRRLMCKMVTLKDARSLLKEEDVLELKDPKTLALDIEQLKGEALSSPIHNRQESTPPMASEAKVQAKVLPKEKIEVEKVSKKIIEERIILPTISEQLASLNKEIEVLDFSRPEDLKQLTILTQSIQKLLKVEAPIEKVVEIRPITKKKLVKKTAARKKKNIPPQSIPDQKDKEVEQIASKSVEKNESLASETLAMILEKQGLIIEAIEMYEQLILTFPKKKTFFAAKINSLKK